MSVGQQLVRAIRRIEHERACDADELRSLESQYSAFKKDNRGVLGWFRRHVPFFQARRLDVQHNDKLSDPLRDEVKSECKRLSQDR